MKKSKVQMSVNNIKESLKTAAGQNKSWMEDVGSTMFSSDSNIRFTTWDYLMFALLLGLSTLIGVYYGFFAKRKQNNTAEYLLGGKQMNTFPVSVSLIAR